MQRNRARRRLREAYRAMRDAAPTQAGTRASSADPPRYGSHSPSSPASFTRRLSAIPGPARRERSRREPPCGRAGPTSGSSRRSCRGACRFAPTCSEYARLALVEHGLLRGDGARGLALGALPSVPSRRVRSAAGSGAAGLTMEKRAILAAVLMAAVFLVYQMFFLPEPPPPQKPPAPDRNRGASPRRHSARRSGGEAPAAPSRSRRTCPSGAGRPRPPQRLVTVEAPLYRAVVSSEGGKIQEFGAQVSRREADGHRRRPRASGAGTWRPTRAALAEVVPMSFEPRTRSSCPTSDAELVLTGEASTGLKRSPDARDSSLTAYAIEAHVRVENPANRPAHS